MNKIKIGCETYTWQMPGEMYKGKLEHIIKVVSRAGFTGIEPETSFFGSLEDPVKMKETLDTYQIELAALCHVEDWRNKNETAEERYRAEKWMDFLSHFPNTIYLLVQMPGADRSDLSTRQQNLLRCINSVGERAAAKGIESSFHPNSPSGSVFRTEEDYKILMDGLQTKHVMYCPDVGHIAKGGMDPMNVLTQYREIINLVHYKDIYKDGRWAQTGDGKIDFKKISGYLKATGYQGWIIMEDECDRAIKDPDGLTMEDGKYIDTMIRPWL